MTAITESLSWENPLGYDKYRTHTDERKMVQLSYLVPAEWCYIQFKFIFINQSMLDKYGQVNSTRKVALYQSSVLSVKFEVGVSLLLAPAGADKRGPKTPFLQWKMQEYSRQFTREYPPELRREPGLIESTGLWLLRRSGTTTHIFLGTQRKIQSHMRPVGC